MLHADLVKLSPFSLAQKIRQLHQTGEQGVRTLVVRVAALKKLREILMTVESQQDVDGILETGRIVARIRDQMLQAIV